MPQLQPDANLPPHYYAELHRLMAEEILGVAIFLIDINGCIVTWTKGAQQMKGYTAEDALGQHLRLLYTDQDRKRGWPEHNLGKANELGVFSEENWRQRKDRSLFWAHIVITALRDESGALQGYSKVTLDLTEHKRLEQCMKEKDETARILRAAEAGTWKWDTASDQVEVSPHFMEMQGFPRTLAVQRFEDWLSGVHPEDAPRIRSQLHEVREDCPHSFLATELRMRRADDAYRWFYVRAEWVQEGEQAPHALMGVNVDIQGLKTAEEERRQMFMQLHAERLRFAEILEQLPSGVILADIPSGRLTYQNRAAERMLGRPLEIGDDFQAYTHYQFMDMAGEIIPAEMLPLARAVLAHDEARDEDLIYRRPGGERINLSVTASSIVDSDGIARIAVAVFHDVTGFKETALQLSAEKERAQVTLAAITDGVLTTDLNGVIASINPAAERLTGWRGQEAVGRPVEEVCTLREEGSGSSGGSIVGEMLRALHEAPAASAHSHTILHARNGREHAVESAIAPIHLSGGRCIGAVLVLHDVTEARRLLHQLGFEASHDALTGLINRREFEKRLQRALAQVKRANGAAGALLYMDLDQFKVVNDTCGHSAGDELLHQLAQQYRQHVRERDTLARIGGDEFALILEHCTLDEAAVVAQKILENTENFRYACTGRIFKLGVSIGLIAIDSDTATVEQALRQADHACYIAKESGRNRVYLQKHGDFEIKQRHSDMFWATRLSEAFQTEQLQLYYQPIMAMDEQDKRPHYEILLRLKDAESGPISPLVFLPAAERYDLMPTVDRWVLKKSLAWLEAHPEHVQELNMCTINLSRRTLADQSFQKYAAALIDNTSIPAEKLCFEITESGAIANMQKTISFINTLAARGCRFSLDDFGTGMTSFSYLKQLPVDFIKIDGSFIQMMGSSQVDYEMVRFTNDISHMMGRKTIAEYVTDRQILEELRQVGVDYAQGYWIGEPVPL